MTELITDAFDVIATIMLAVAVAGGLWEYVGWWALVPSAIVFIVGSQIIARFQGD